MRIPGVDLPRHARVAPLTLKHSNLPGRYVKRYLEHVEYKAPKLPNYRQITEKQIKNHFDVYRPWTLQFQIQNMPGNKHRKVFVEPIKEWLVFRGDRVEILTGKDKGKHGIVCEIIQERNWVFVEGLNTKVKLLGKTDNFGGRYTQIEMPLMVTTDVALVDPGDLKPCKVSWRYNEKGEKVRVSHRTGRIIPMPILEEETFDYKTKNTYKEQSKDTTAAETTKITFKPTLQTFAMSIMEEMGIKEDRVPAKAYCQNREENGIEERTHSYFRPINTYRVGDNQTIPTINPEIVKNDVEIPQNLRSKKKKGASDPRFKRIINKENETEASRNEQPEASNDQENDGAKDKIISLLKPPKDFGLYAKSSTKKFGDAPENGSSDLTDLVTKDVGLQPSNIPNDNNNSHPKKHQSNLKNSNKIKKIIKTGLKKSASDCTLHTKNIYGDEIEELQKTRINPSGTQITSSTNSRKSFKPDKRRSVITVIGQTQTRPFNELLQEINQRRKLAKELDRHALCEAILESNESRMEVRNLIAKVDFFSPDGKVIYSTEKVYLCKDKYKDCGLCLTKSRETSEDQFKKRQEMIPERDSSISQADKKCRPKHLSKKLMTTPNEKTQLKEKLTHLMPKLFVAFFIIALFFISVLMYTESIKPLRTYYSFHRLFSTQTIPWYEKLLL